MPKSKLKASPVPLKVFPSEVITRFDFPTAIKKMTEGERVTKLEWNDKSCYGLVRSGILTIYRNGQFHQWVISDGDLAGQDWYVIPQGN